MYLWISFFSIVSFLYVHINYCICGLFFYQCDAYNRFFFVYFNYGIIELLFFQCDAYCCSSGSPWSCWSSGGWWLASWWTPCPADRDCRCTAESAPPAPRKSLSPAPCDIAPHRGTSPSSSPSSWEKKRSN